MENSLAVFVTWGAHLVDGNHLTNLISIGHKTAKTGRNPPRPATVGGLNTHGVFEGECKHLRTFRGDAYLIWLQGDASTTREDAYFGDNHSFNEGLFQQVRSYFSRGSWIVSNL